MAAPPTSQSQQGCQESRLTVDTPPPAPWEVDTQLLPQSKGPLGTAAESGSDSQPRLVRVFTPMFLMGERS